MKSKSWNKKLIKAVRKTIKSSIRFYKNKIVKDRYAGIKKTPRHSIEHARNNLMQFGFTEKSLEDLNAWVETGSKKMRKKAAWALAFWHADQYKKENAELCLYYLNKALKGEDRIEQLRYAAIIKAECYNLLGDLDAAKKAINDILDLEPHGDLYLGFANLEKTMSSKLDLINEAFKLHNIKEVVSYDESANTYYDALGYKLANKFKTSASKVKPAVTVIVPAYQSEEVIKTALSSLLYQTWDNLEILVVDDGSNDGTVQIVEDHKKTDSRVKLLRTSINSGPYVARNLALSKASGEFVTCHDADDWSHPEKIEKQVLHLMNNPDVLGNTSQQARATDNLQFHRRGNPGFYIQMNMSSFMFRREPVLNNVGFWDSVRFVGDSEYIQRIKKVFGKNSVVNMESGPLSFQRQTSKSLTGDPYFGYQGYKVGARKEYELSYRHYFKNTDKVFVNFPQEKRPFPVPEPMRPNREIKDSTWRHFDIVLASEFRLPGGTNYSNIEELKVHSRLGLKTGLVHMARYDRKPGKDINPQIRNLIDGTKIQMLVYGEKITCDLLIVRHPPVLQDLQRYIPDVKAKDIRVIVNQTPRENYGPKSESAYDISKCAANLKNYFGKVGIWHPIGPLVRNVLQQYHADDLKEIFLSEEDWGNIIDVKEWSRGYYYLSKDKIRIGRHSRDSYVKWPDNASELLAVYPNSDRYEIVVLGGAESPHSLLGGLPENWKVYKFGEMDPKKFLSQLDVFVYYTRSDCVESFGRSILEAMAVGVPTVLPPVYRELFGEAALYGDPCEVQEIVNNLVNNQEEYQRQVEKAWQFVENHFGSIRHADRLSRILNNNFCNKEKDVTT